MMTNKDIDECLVMAEHAVTDNIQSALEEFYRPDVETEAKILWAGLPEPVKKKYYRIHIAYLIIICSLKQSLSIPTLQTMIPPDLTEEELRQVYCAYAARHQIACSYFIRQIRDMSAKILDHEQAPAFAAENTSELIYTVAVASGIARLLAEKLLLLEGKTLEDGGSIEPFSPERAKDEG